VTGRIGAILTGLVLGFCLSRIGFSSWDEVHRMFLFADLRMFLAFATGVTILGLAWIVAARLSGAPIGSPRRIHPGTVAGGAVFGTGWALAGACPGIALVQIGEGQVGAVLTFAAMVAGNFAYSSVHERFLRWPVQSCAED